MQQTTNTTDLEAIANEAGTYGLQARINYGHGQVTVYGPSYDGTSRTSMFRKVTDKLRITADQVVGLTGNNERTFVTERGAIADHAWQSRVDFHLQALADRG